MSGLQVYSELFCAAAECYNVASMVIQAVLCLVMGTLSISDDKKVVRMLSSSTLINNSYYYLELCVFIVDPHVPRQWRGEIHGDTVRTGIYLRQGLVEQLEMQNCRVRVDTDVVPPSV